MHFDVVLSVFIHPCTKKRRRAQVSIRAELTRLSMCVRALQMCTGKTSHSALDCYSNKPERLLCSPCALVRAVLILSPDT